MKVLIVDDEHLARQRIVRMLDAIEDHDAVGEAANGIDAVKLAEEINPDVVLLDIRMPGMDGLEAALHIAGMEEPPAVIFCTAYEEHAIEAFDVQAVGYLLKPVRRDALAGALAKASRTNKAQLTALSALEENRRTHISARTRRGIELVSIDDVRFFQADQKYVTVRHASGEILIDETLRELENEFENQFVRVHRNSLVASRYIEGLDRDSEGHYQIRLNGIDAKVDVSRRHLSRVRKFVRSL
ncbi:MAG: LytTR family DNA-binding domain-containing protein [Gammaproteobacteria bacterium]|nr:LytTR family DNA-binding domain-containing protein [Gammaproteobacteria bacterium]